MLEVAVVPVEKGESVIESPEWLPITGLRSPIMRILSEKIASHDQAVMMRESEEFPDCPVVLICHGRRLFRQYVVSARVQNLHDSGESMLLHDCQYFNLVGFAMDRESEHEPIGVDPVSQAYKGILQTVVDFRDYVVKLRLLMESMLAVDYFIDLVYGTGYRHKSRATIKHVSMLGLNWRVRCGQYVLSCSRIVNGLAQLRLHFNGRSRLLIWSGSLKKSWYPYDSDEFGLQTVVPFQEPDPEFRKFVGDGMHVSVSNLVELTVSGVRVVDMVWLRGLEVLRHQEEGSSPYYLVHLTDFNMTVLTDCEVYCEVRVSGRSVRFASCSVGYKVGHFRVLSLAQRDLIVSCVGVSMVGQFGT